MKVRNLPYPFLRGQPLKIPMFAKKHEQVNDKGLYWEMIKMEIRNFLQYYSILSSIPQNWKKPLQENSQDPVTPTTSTCSLSCKAIYIVLLNLDDLPPPTSEKKLLMSGVEKSDLNKIYLLPFKATREIKWTMFQYKIIHRILPTNSLLHKMKKVASPSSPFCPSEHQTLWHLFINCKQATSFWNRFQE